MTIDAATPAERGRRTRRPPGFRKSDIVRALSSLTAVGIKPVKVEIDVTGKFVIHCGDAAAPKAVAETDTMTPEEEKQWATSRAAARRAAEKTAKGHRAKSP